MIIKEVKEYSGRQRITLNKNDNIPPGSEVAILPLDEYRKFKSDVYDLQHQNTALTEQLEIYQEQENNLKEIVEDITAPIHEHYQKLLDDKDEQITALTNELKQHDRRTNTLNLSIMGLNGIELLILRKHKRLITEFNAEMNIELDDQKIIDTEKSEDD